MSLTNFSNLKEFCDQTGVEYTGILIFCIGLVFILGLVFGSFLNVCIYRLQNGESIVWGRSHCMSCKAKIKAYDLIPLFSYLFLKGRCRNCGAKISIRYPIVELANALLVTGLFLRFGLSLEWLFYSVLISLLLICSFIDYDSQTIPDGLVLCIFMLGLIMIFAAKDMTWPERVIGLFTASVPLLLAVVLSKGGMGGGDVKLMAAAGLCIGWKLSLLTLLIGSVIAAITGLIYAAEKHKQGQTQTMKLAIPFGPFLSIGIAVSVFAGPGLIAWYLNLFGLN